MASDKRGNNGRPRKEDVRARKALQHHLNGETKQKACELAGYAKTTARHHATAILRRVQGELCEELERQGLDAPTFAGSLIDGLKATQRQYFNGEVVDETPDFRARAQFSKMVIDVCGDAAPVKHDHTHEGHVTVVQIRKEQTRLENAIDEWLE